MNKEQTDVVKVKGKQRQRIKKWIEHLRSGKYKQGKDSLRHENKFCCLGVGCDYYARSNRLKGAWEGEPDDYEFKGDCKYSDTGSMPKEVLDWFGINIGYASDLINMNDDEGKTFKTIAKKIEKDLL